MIELVHKGFKNIYEKLKDLKATVKILRGGMDIRKNQIKLFKLKNT